MSNEELQALVEEVSQNYFGRPFSHQAVFNRRLKTTGGRYHLKDHHLDFNPSMLEEHGLQTFLGIIKHELCHYHLHLTGKGYRHRDRDFQILLAKTGGARYAPASVKSATKLIYQCQSCHKNFPRKRRIDTHKYVCGDCRGKLILLAD